MRGDPRHIGTIWISSSVFPSARYSSSGCPLMFTSEEEYLESLLTATPIGHSPSGETPEVQHEILRKTRSNLQAWTTPNGLRIPAEAAVVTAHR